MKDSAQDLCATEPTTIPSLTKGSVSWLRPTPTILMSPTQTDLGHCDCCALGAIAIPADLPAKRASRPKLWSNSSFNSRSLTVVDPRLNRQPTGAGRIEMAVELEFPVISETAVVVEHRKTLPRCGRVVRQ